ncbi:YhjD/YihY/BrkB family envelope integrity protein [Pedococcus sp. KACC 23699]|uniref:YhjD/YihY/BrkB family envelope integrity protein n=1 Tax=Pedococcus sp. KACC 23699 TaxID=3149228 RepID=A0AAU7JTZ8_9MICO
MPLRAIGARLKESFPGRCARTFVEQQGLDRAMAIASQSFTALIPLLILASAALPTGSEHGVADAIVGKFGLSGDAEKSVRLVFAQTQPGSVGVGSLFLLLFSGVSLTRRLQRMYLQAYDLPPSPGVRGTFNASLGLAAFLAEVGLLSLLRSIVRSLPFDWASGLPLTMVVGVLFWTTVPFLLLDRRMPWRRLLPAGALAGVAVSLYGVATTFYMPVLMTSYSRRYGLFGITVAIVGWLLCMAVIVVSTTIVAAEFDRAREPWACRLRATLGFDQPLVVPEGAPLEDEREVSRRWQ